MISSIKSEQSRHSRWLAWVRWSAAAQSDIPLRDIASNRFVVVHEDDIVFDVIQGIWRNNATMAVVLRGGQPPELAHVVGVISNEHVADSVAGSIAVYPG